MTDIVSLLIIFGFILALVALNGWFAMQRRNARETTAAAGPALERAVAQATRLEERVDALERILDDDVPGWRRKVRA